MAHCLLYARYGTLWLLICLFTTLFLHFGINANEVTECKKLDTGFSYNQENAPKDISAILGIVTNKINREITYVSKVEVNYDGDDIHSVVGDHDVIASVKRLDEDGLTQHLCFNITFHIADVDECALPASHSMAPKCHRSSRCVNTIGSYECQCLDGEVALEGAGMGLCGGARNTSCCLEGGQMGRKAIAACKADFRCPEDQCPGDCVAGATCIPSKDKSSYSCQCKSGLVGNGRKCTEIQPKAWKTRTGTLLPGSEDVCGCQTPRVDHCHNVVCGDNAFCRSLDYSHECVCRPGFKFIEELGCMDEKLPTMTIKGKNPMHLQQCDNYEEYGVHIVDENDEGLTRNVHIEYSQPLGYCLREMGSFHVNYTLETPWTNPSFIRLTRWVEVEDINECNLDKEVTSQCPDCLPRCSPEATCSNTIGSYTCTCPSCMRGDGFIKHKSRPGTAPYGYLGGTGCRDICAPVIILSGPNPYYFRVPKCYGLEGPYASNFHCQPDWKAELTDLIQRTNGQVLCGSKSLPCASASDDTGTGKVDLSENVTVGNPIALSNNQSSGQYSFKVPYDVKDAVGNRATTVYRTVIIQEKTLDEVEAEARRPIDQPQREECPKCTCPTCPPCSNKKCPECRCPSCPTVVQEQSCPDTDTIPQSQQQPQQQPYTTGFESTGFQEDFTRIFLQLVIVAVGILTVIFLGQVIFTKFAEPPYSPAAGTPSHYRPLSRVSPASAGGPGSAHRTPSSPFISPKPAGLNREYSVISARQ
mmetsp:Transcript_27936/g.35016  ORF Transcript_27936/g.35016 Transcript_27936/m.35016 type:complete len:757 (+) Transcript_27936:49-2319(+)